MHANNLRPVERARALLRCIVCAGSVGLGLTGTAHALDAPTLLAARLAGSEVRLTLSGANDLTGINVYRNGRYHATRRDLDADGSVSISGDAARYCVVGFLESAAATRYSACSNSLPASPSSEDRTNDTGPVDDPPAGQPGAPANLRITRYSGTAAELFWEPASSTAGIRRYDIRRDAITVGSTEGRSFFDSTLSPASRPSYDVVAIDRNGQIGPAARVSLDSSLGRTPDTTAGFELQLAQSSISLTEGASARAAIRIQRNNATGRTITLTLHAAGDGDQRNLSHWFEPQTLGSDRADSALHLSLAVAAKPIGFQERRVIVRATDGTSTREQTLVLNITPTERPDVYLLIGQSNMVGSSERWAKNAAAGGPDESHPRIRQLNVRQNNRGIFYAPDKFRDAYYNVLSPLFIDAEDPLHEPRYPWTARKEATHIGLGLSFAKAALADTTRQVILVPAAWGATGFCDGGNGDLAWNAWPTSTPGLGGTLLADRAITRLNLALSASGGILRGILWHQGGHDSNDWRCAERYRDNLIALVRRLRSEALVDARGSGARGNDADVPFIVATQSRGRDARGDFSRYSASKQRVDQAHRSVASYLTHAAFVNNDDLVPPQYPCGQSSCVHFGAAALREQGVRFYEALQRVWQR